jgi:very-short-patch-repair endonuclease
VNGVSDSPSPVSLRETVLSPGGRGESAAPFPSPPRGEDGLRSKPGEGESKKPITHRLPHKTAFARKLRENETEEEWFLWSDLKDRRLNGHKFVRQIPLGPYIVDFLCRSHHLIVELDGVQHAESPYDDSRTIWLNRNGYSMLRFWNSEIRRERTAVLETILAVLEGRIFEACATIRFSPSHSPSPGLLRKPPSPRGGEAKEERYSPLPHGERTVSRSETGEGESISQEIPGRQ